MPQLTICFALSLALIVTLLTFPQPCESVDPYLVLLLQQTASYQQVTQQYEKLSNKLKGNSNTSQKKRRMYDEAYKEIVLAYILEDKMQMMGDDTAPSKHTNTVKSNPKVKASTPKSTDSSPRNNPTSSASPQTLNLNTTSNSTSNYQTNSNYELAKIIYSFGNILLKLVPLGLLVWFCMKNSENFQANQENAGAWRNWKRKQK